MSRRGAAALAAVSIAGLIGLVAAAALDRRDLAFSNGVPIVRVAAVLAPAATACQRNVEVQEGFAALELVPRRLGRPGPPLHVRLVDRAGGRVLASVPVPAGYADNRPLRVGVAPVPAGRHIDVCVVNRGGARLGLEGGKAESVPSSPLTVAGRRHERSAIALRFLRERPRSALSQVPTMFERAALFRPGWVGPWTFWLLAVAVGAGVPLLLARAVARAAAEPAPSGDGSPRPVDPGAP